MVRREGDGEGAEPGALAAVRRVGRTAAVSVEAVQAIARSRAPAGRYPPSPVGRQLESIARLLRGARRTRVFYATIGGFDCHAGERERQANLLATVSEAVIAFYRDLEVDGQAGRVVLLAFSEFGRRVRENASGGTDHGRAGPVLVLGGPVRGGFHGDHPSLSDLEDGDLRHGIDFRSVYAALLEDWLGVPAADVLGRPFEKLGLIRKG